MSFPVWGRRFRARAIAIAVLGIGLLLTTLGALRAQRLRGHARAEVMRVLHEASGLRVRVNDARLDFSDLSLLARGVELDDAQGRSVLSARTIRIRSSLRALLGGRAELRSVEISNAVLNVGARDVHWPRPGTQRGRWPIDTLFIRDSRFVIDLVPLASVDLSHADLELRATTSGLSLKMKGGRAAVEHAGERVLQGQLRLLGSIATRGDESHGRFQLSQTQLAGRAFSGPIDLAWRLQASRLGLQGTLALGGGTLALSATLPLEQGQPLELRLQPRGLRASAALGQLGLSAGKLDALLDGDVDLRGGVQPLRLDGRVQVDAREVRLGDAGVQPALLAPRGLRASAALGQLGLSAGKLDALLDGDVDLRGSVQPFRLDGRVQIDAREVRLGDARVQPALLAPTRLRASATARVDAASLALDALQLETGSSVLRGHAQLGYDGAIAAALSGDAVELADLSPIAGVKLAGRGRLDLQAQGSVQAPDLHAVLAVEGGALAGIELGKVSADVHVEEAGRVLRFDRAEIATRERRASADGLRLRFDDQLSVAQARLRIARLPLTDLYRLLGATDDPVLSRLQGTAEGSAELGFARSAAGQKLDLALALELGEASLDGYPFDRGRLQARVAIPDASRGLGEGALALEQLALRAGDGRLELSGNLQRGQVAMKVAIGGLPLDRMPWLRAHMPDLDGKLTGSGNFSGTAASSRADLELAVDELSLAGHRLGRAKVLAALRDRADAATQVAGAKACSEGQSALASGAMRASAKSGASDSAWLICGDGLGGRLHLDVALGTSSERTVRGSVGVDGFDLAPFLPERAPGARVRGKLSASLQIADGGLAVPQRISGRVSVRKLDLGEGDLALTNHAPFELQLREGALELHDATLEGPNFKLELSAGGSLHKGVRLFADGTAQAGLLSRASHPLAQAFGDLSVHLEWSPSATPSLSGQAEMRDVLVQAEPGMRIRKLHGKLVLVGDRVRLEDVAAELGEGALRVGGELALQGLRVASYDLAIEADAVALEPQPRLEAVLDAHTRLQWGGSAAPPKLTGTVNFKRVLYARHIQLPEALTAINQKDRETMAAFDAARDRLVFDLEIAHEQPMRVRNNFLDAELVAQGAAHKLRVVGSDQRFGLLGKVAITRGRVLYRGDEFVITRGEVAFDDERRVAPSFDVRAVAERRKHPDASIVFLARGTRDAFGIDVRCDANAVTTEPPPFTCDYAHDRLRCDSFDRLVALWLCRSKTALSSAEITR